MELGAFSVSLAVKNLQTSKEFYEQLGFTKFHGDESQNWLIMKNGNTAIGLFQGMFENNIMTFNPGWDNNAEDVNPFTDIREIHKKLKDSGMDFISEIEAPDEGPASFMIADPDGNTILVDQHR